MKMIEYFIIAWRDILNRKIRSFLTVISISIGSMLLVGMLGLGDVIIKSTRELTKSFGMVNEINVLPIDYNNLDTDIDENQISIGLKDKLGNENKIVSEFANLIGKNKNKNILKSDIKLIDKIENVDYTVAFIKSRFTGVEIGTYGIKNLPGETIGISLDSSEDIKEKVIVGKSALNTNEEIIIGERLLNTLGFKNYNDIIGRPIKIAVEYPEFNGEAIKESVTVEGILVGVIDKKSKFSNNIIMSDKKVELIASYFTSENGYIDEYGYDGVWVFVKSGKSITKVADKIIEETGFVTFSFQMLSALVEVLNGVVKAVLAVGGMVVLIVASLGLVNTMTMTVQEKKNMIGVMRAVGASKSDIKLIFIFQGVIIGTLGGILGVLLSFIVLYLINVLVAIPRGVIIPITIVNINISIIITLVTTTIASLIPASRASRADIIKTLSEE